MLTKNDLHMIEMLFDRKFDEKFDEKFEEIFDRKFDEKFDEKFDAKFDEKFDEKFEEMIPKIRKVFVDEVAKFKDDIVGRLDPLQTDHDVLSNQVSELRQAVAMHDHTTAGLSWIKSIHLSPEETLEARENLRIWREEYLRKKALGQL